MCLAFIRDRFSFVNSHYEAVVKAVEAVDEKIKREEEELSQSLSQSLSISSTGSIYQPKPGRSYKPKPKDILERAKVVRSVVELNVSSVSMAPMLEMFTGTKISDRQIRR